MPLTLVAESDRSPTPAFDGGHIGPLIGTRDWSSSPLGPVEHWPERLTSLIEVVLASKTPMFLLWGAERTFLYNDAYIPVLGHKHPWALGQGLFEVWPEVRELIEPVIEQAYAGQSSYFEDLPVVLQRSGQPEQTYFTFSYTPVRARAGAVVGALCSLQETTNKVQAERRLEFLLRLTDELRGLDDPLEVVCEAAGMLGEHLGVSRVGYGDVDESARYFTTARNWTDGTVEHHTGTHDLAAFGTDIHAALQRGEPLVLQDVVRDPRTNSPASLAAFAHLDIASAVTVSLIKQERMVAALYVHSRLPRAWSEAEIRLIQDVAERTWDAVERARAEAARRTSEGRLRLAVDAGRMAVWEHDSTTDTITTTPELNRLFGYPADARPTAAEIRAQYPPGERDLVVAAAAEAIKRGENFFEVEYRFRRLDGSLCWFLMRAEMDLSPEGMPTRSVGVVLDITDRKQNEEELREREAELRTALEAGALAVFDYYHTTGRMRSSPRLNEMYGYPPDRQLTIQDIRARYHPEHLDEIATRLRQRDEDATLHHFDWTTRLLLPGGAVRWLNGRGEYVRNEAGRAIRSRGVVMDITERKHAEEANARLAAIVSCSSDAIISYAAADGRILTWNKGAEALFGYTAAEALGGPVGLVVPQDRLGPQEDETGAYNRALREGHVQVETVRRRKDGTLVDVSISATRMTDPNGHVLGVSAVIRDITERKRWEEHQRLLINELNHRVKNTLATVQSIASQSLRSAATPEEARQAVEERLFALSRVHNVLTRENWEGAAIREVVDEAVAPYQPKGRNRIHIAGPDRRLSPRMSLALAMALQELATNAVKYGALSNETGEVRLEWQVDESGKEPRLHLTWAESGGPSVKAPSRQGFGTRLIERSLAQDLEGEVRLAFEPTGLVCTIQARLEKP